jgi:hypothetical protein
MQLAKGQGSQVLVEGFAKVPAEHKVHVIPSRT